VARRQAAAVTSGLVDRESLVRARPRGRKVQEGEGSAARILETFEEYLTRERALASATVESYRSTSLRHRFTAQTLLDW
jgi:hypothetical protein